MDCCLCHYSVLWLSVVMGVGALAYVLFIGWQEHGLISQILVCFNTATLFACGDGRGWLSLYSSIDFFVALFYGISVYEVCYYASMMFSITLFLWLFWWTMGLICSGMAISCSKCAGVNFLNIFLYSIVARRNCPLSEWKDSARLIRRSEDFDSAVKKLWLVLTQYCYSYKISHLAIMLLSWLWLCASFSLLFVLLMVSRHTLRIVNTSESTGLLANTKFA